MTSSLLRALWIRPARSGPTIPLLTHQDMPPIGPTEDAKCVLVTVFPCVKGDAHETHSPCSTPRLHLITRGAQSKMIGTDSSDGRSKARPYGTPHGLVPVTARHSAAMGDGIADSEPPRGVNAACDLVEMQESSASSTRATLTEQVRERSFVNHGCPGTSYPRFDVPAARPRPRGSVSAFTRRPSA